MNVKVDRETKFRLPVPNEDGDMREHRIVKCIVSNREKVFMAVVTSDCIYIWLAYVRSSAFHLIFAVDVIIAAASSSVHIEDISWRCHRKGHVE